MAPILERILTGKEPSPFILVKDTLEQSGQLIGFELLSYTPKEYGRQKTKAGRSWIQITESTKRKKKRLIESAFICHLRHAIILVCAETDPARLVGLVKGEHT